MNIELEEHNKADYDYQNTVATVFSVARRAKEIFNGSEASEKRIFLNFLLQNPTVKDKKLEFTLRSPFNLILESSTTPLRGRALSGVITVLEDRGYMITVREKMNNIKKVAKFYNYDFLATKSHQLAPVLSKNRT